MLDNRPAFLIHWLALNGLGAAVVPISGELRSAELEYLIEHSGIGLAVATSDRHALLQTAAQAAGCVLSVIGPDGSPPPAADAPPFGRTRPGLGTECGLLYTSGTTGRPKGCMLSNRYYLLAAQWYAALDGHVSLRIGCERMITPLPVNHMNAMAFSVVTMIVTGGCISLVDRFHPDGWWPAVREFNATVIHYLGVMPAMLMKAAVAPSDQDHTVRFGFGAGVNRSLHEPFEARFGFPLIEGWSMTETGAGAVLIAHREPRAVGTNCFGPDNPEVEVRILADSGGEAAPDEPGELLVRHRGPDPRDGFYSGYLKDPQATDEAWAGGWFHTGDVVSRDAAGLYHFIDRRKNVIRRSGENIAAVEVESVLLQHPLVRAVAVAATPDPVRGDEVLACVIAADPPADDPARREAAVALVQWCLERLAYYKAPGYVAFVDALPLTPSQKVQRGELKALAARLPGTQACVDTRALKKRQA
jgi:acyl-CoA synthetase (AMP-forming)/AMP-acid ligase II